MEFSVRPSSIHMLVVATEQFRKRGALFEEAECICLSYLGHELGAMAPAVAVVQLYSVKRVRVCTALPN